VSRFFFREIRYAFRRLSRRPGLVFTAILTIALAIGAATSIFSVLRAVLFQRLPFADPERIVSINNQVRLNTLSRSTFYESAHRLVAFKDVAEYHPSGANLVTGTAVQRRSACEVSATFFSVLGVRPILGRDFTADEDRPGHDLVALISYRLWQEIFRGDLSVVGRSLNLNGLTFTVIGVLPSGVFFPQQTDVWVPTIFDNDAYVREGTALDISAVGRLSAQSTLGSARAELNEMAQETSALGSPFRQDDLPRIELLASQLTQEMRPALLILNLAVLFVLLIMCANIAHLMVVHTSARIGEICLRSALGASRGVLALEQLMEMMLLTIPGGSLGIVFAVYITPSLEALAPGGLGHYLATTFAWPIALYGFSAIVITGGLSGLVPAWFALRQSSRPYSNIYTGHWTSAAGSVYGKLVISEIASALILLVGAGAFVRTLSEMKDTLFAYDTHGILTFSISPHGPVYVDFKSNIIHTDQINKFYFNALARLGDVPRVTEAAIINRPPIPNDTDNVLPVVLEDESLQSVHGTEYIVSPSYFRTMGIRIVDGRVPTQAELAGDRLAIVSQSFAAQLWSKQSPIGKRLVLPIHGFASYKVIGVAANSYGRVWKTKGSPELYLFLGQVYCPSATFILRTAEDPTLLFPFVRQVLAALDREQPPFDIRTMDQRVAAFEANQRFALFVLCGFAAIAVLLAVGGLYSTIQTNLQLRIREIAIRIALGADAARILRMVLIDSCKLAIPGISLGIVGATILVRLAAAKLFGVSAVRFLDISCIVLVFFLVIIAAAYIPGKRAARVQPAELLRFE
jgi:putative ABC transport system permease protein